MPIKSRWDVAWRTDFDNGKPISGEAEKQMWGQERLHQVAEAFDVNSGKLQRGVHCSYKGSRDHWERRYPWRHPWRQLALYVSSAEKTLPPMTQMLGISRSSAQRKLPILIAKPPREIHTLKPGRKESHGKPGFVWWWWWGVEKHSCHLGQISHALFTLGKGHPSGSLPRPALSHTGHTQAGTGIHVGSQKTRQT